MTSNDGSAGSVRGVDPAGDGWPKHWTINDQLSDLHARYHDQKGNLLGPSECGFERCGFWDAAFFALSEPFDPAAPAVPEGRADGRCPGALIVKGEHYACDNTYPHDGWACSNGYLGAIWQGDKMLLSMTLAAPAVPEGRADGRAEEVWLPGMLATIWWSVDGGPIGVNHAMRRDDDWVACGDVAVPDQFVIKAERIVLPDPQPLPDGLNDINPSRNGDFTAPVVGEREEKP